MNEELGKLRALVSHMGGLRTAREGAWRELSRWLCGYRGVFDGTRVDDYDRGDLTLFRGVASQALLRGASGMTSGMTPRNVSWFKPGFSDEGLEEASGARQWLDRVDMLIKQCLVDGGFYQAIQRFNLDLIWAGCGLLYCERGTASALRYECCQPGSFYVALDQEGRLEAVARLLMLTVTEAARVFGKERLSGATARKLEKEPYAMLRVWHLARRVSGGRFAIASDWWEERGEDFLRRGGFYEMPYFFTVWNEGATPYGTGPGDDCLADARQLDMLERQKLAGLGRLVEPPLVANGDLKESVDLAPGALNFVGLNQQVLPILDLSPYASAMPHILAEIQTVSQRVEKALLASVFDSMPLDQRPRDMSATEFLERKREALQQLGPVISAYEPNVLTPLLAKTALVLDRAGLTPPPPDSLANVPLFMKMEFISPMANALRQSGAEAVRAIVQDVAGLAQISQNPDVLDKLDLDQAVDELAKGIGAPGSVIRSDDDVQKLRKQKQDAAQQLQLAQLAANAAEKT